MPSNNRHEKSHKRQRSAATSGQANRHLKLSPKVSVQNQTNDQATKEISQVRLGRDLRTELQQFKTATHHPPDFYQTRSRPPPRDVHSSINERRQLCARSRERQHPTAHILHKSHPPRSRNTISNDRKGSPCTNNSSSPTTPILSIPHSHRQNKPPCTKNPPKTRFGRPSIFLGHRIVRIQYLI